MAVSRTRVVGPVGLPDGTPAPDGALIRFTLPAWDKDGDALIVPGRVETVVEGGAIDVDLWRTGAGERTLTYDVTAIYHNVFADRRMEIALGRISLLSAGPFALADLLSLPAPVPDVPDALALARASADAARTSAAQSQAWAESPSAPDPDVPASKSAKTLAGEAAASATAADSHRAAAVTARDAAAASRTAAAGSATAASTSATAAAGSASAANTSAVAAAASKTATAADAVATAQDRTAVAADRTTVGTNLASAVAQADIARAQAVISTTQAGIATTKAGEATTSAGAAAASAAAAQGVVIDLETLQDLTESEHLQRIVSLADITGAAGGVPYLTAPGVFAFLASSEAGRALLAQLGAANTLPYYTGTGAVARATLTPAARAALALAGVASAKRISVLTGTTTAELAAVGQTGLDVLAAATDAEGLTAMSAVGFIAQTLTAAQKTQAQTNIGGSNIGRVVFGAADHTAAAEALRIINLGSSGIGVWLDFRVPNGEVWRMIFTSSAKGATSSADLGVSFGFAFVNAPMIVISNGDASAEANLMVSIYGRTETGFVITARKGDAFHMGAYRTYWIAIGRVS